MAADLKIHFKNGLCINDKEENTPDKIYVLNNVDVHVQEKLKLQGINFFKIDEPSALSILDEESQLLFVLQEFEGVVFEAISKTKNNRILGPTAVMELLNKNLPITPRKNNVYCLSMDGLIFYLSAKKNKEEMIKIANLIRQMGGSVRCNYRNITHYVTNSAMCGGYEYAITFLIPVMSPQWVKAAWERRHMLGFKANCEEMMLKYKLKPFAEMYVSFVGFPKEDNSHLVKLQENEGKHVELIDERCTHVVIDLPETNTTDELLHLRNREHVYTVKAAWFWESIEKGKKLAERDYEYKIKIEYICDNKQLLENEDKNDSCHHQPGHHKPESNFKNQSEIQKLRTPAIKKEDSCGSCSSNISTTEDAEPLQSPCEILEDASFKECDNEHPSIIEFIETEERYLSILNVIVQEEELKHLYPAFIKGFKESQRLLQICSKEKPKFKQIIKEWQGKTESGRQHLGELLIRPIQRLGSVSLLLKEIHKTTPPNSPYRKKIEEALKSLETVMGLMNAGKGRADQMSQLFETYYCIVDCPADLVSSHRTLTAKFMVEELTGRLAPSGDYIVFFMFNDIIEICRIRKRVKQLILAGENEEKYFKAADGKPYKHYVTISIKEIRRVIDIQDVNDLNNAFALVLRKDDEIRERVYFFRYMDKDPPKNSMLRKIALNIAEVNSSPNFNTYFASLGAHEIGMTRESSERVKGGGLLSAVFSLF